MAMCPPGSQDTEFLKELNEVAKYLMQGDQLVLNFKADSGSMSFVPASSAPQAQPGQPGEIPGQDLGGQQWQWTKSTLNNGQTPTPANPADYTIEFSMVDGRVNIKADCNNATGEFMTDGQSLQIMMGAVTLAACPPGSLSDEYLKELSEVSAYSVQGETLTMTTAGGTMTFAGKAMGQAPTAPAGQQPPSQPATPAALEGPTWNWIKTELSNGSVTTAPDPTKYTLKFEAPSHFVFVADCNNGSGSYTLNGSNLTMQVEGMTRAICPPPSDDYVQMLGQVASYKIEGNTLFLALNSGGNMTFTTGGAQPASGTGSNTGAAQPTAPATGSNKDRLTSGVWKWQQSADNSGKTWASPIPANYTVQFAPVGAVAVQIDCNKSNGTYQADESNLTITLGPTTMMACPPPTLDTVFSQQLSEVSSYFFDGPDLIMVWKMDAGSMKFSQ
jgi:heat shock protein HslJ